MTDDAELFRLARGDIPERYANPVCVTVSPSGRAAVALIAANTEPTVEIDATQFIREGDAWAPIGSGGAGGTMWSTFHEEEVLTSPVRAPADARAAIFVWRGEEHTVTVENGYATLVLWNRPFHDYSCPRVRYFVLADGTKVQPPEDGGG